MNACITNFSEVLGHRLSPFSHCYTKRTHFILSCLSDVRFMFNLSKQNTYMTTGHAIFKSTLSLISFLSVRPSITYENIISP